MLNGTPLPASPLITDEDWAMLETIEDPKLQELLRDCMNAATRLENYLAAEDDS